MLEDNSIVLGAYAMLSNLTIESCIDSTALATFFAYFSAISKPFLMSWGYLLLVKVSTILIRNSSLCWLAEIMYDNAVASNMRNCLSNLVTMLDATGLFSI